MFPGKPERAAAQLLLEPRNEHRQCAVRHPQEYGTAGGVLRECCAVPNELLNRIFSYILTVFSSMLSFFRIFLNFLVYVELSRIFSTVFRLC